MTQNGLTEHKTSVDGGHSPSSVLLCPSRSSLTRRNFLPEVARRAPSTTRRSRRRRSLQHSEVGYTRKWSRRWPDQHPSTIKPRQPQRTENPRNRCSAAGKCRRHSRRWGLLPSPRWVPRDPLKKRQTGLGWHRALVCMRQSSVDT